MLKNKPDVGESEFVVVDTMDDDGTLTVRDPAADEEYEIVDYVDEVLYERLAAVEGGRPVNLELTRNRDGDGYAAVRLLPGGSHALGL